jgi:hypothetical protein
MQCWDYTWPDGNDLTDDLAGSIQTCRAHITLIHFPLSFLLCTPLQCRAAPQRREGPVVWSSHGERGSMPWWGCRTSTRCEQRCATGLGEGTTGGWRSDDRPRHGRELARWCHEIELGCGGAPRWAHLGRILMVAATSLVPLRLDPNKTAFDDSCKPNPDSCGSLRRAPARLHFGFDGQLVAATTFLSLSFYFSCKVFLQNIFSVFVR